MFYQCNTFYETDTRLRNQSFDNWLRGIGKDNVWSMREIFIAHVSAECLNKRQRTLKYFASMHFSGQVEVKAEVASASAGFVPWVKCEGDTTVVKMRFSRCG